MYPLGHVTFACGAVWLGTKLLERARQGETVQQQVAASAAQATPREDATRRPSIADAVDYRLVALGALLPDLIDKPIVWVLFPNPDDRRAPYWTFAVRRPRPAAARPLPDYQARQGRTRASRGGAC